MDLAASAMRDTPMKWAAHRGVVARGARPVDQRGEVVEEPAVFQVAGTFFTEVASAHGFASKTHARCADTR